MSEFSGFVAPTTTDTPNELFDIVLPRINNLAELKVVLYIIRRTFGFHKQIDWIALSQFEHGIVTKDGQRLDDGVGLARKTIVMGLERGVNDGYLVKQFRCPDCGTEVKGAHRTRRTGHASKIVLPKQCPTCGGKIRGRVHVFYGLRWANSVPVLPGTGVVTKGNYPSYQRELGVVTKGNPQNTTTTTTTTGNIVDINSQVAAIFAEAVGAERYDPTEKESRQVAALLADGYSAEDIGAGIQRAVQLAAARGQRVRSLAYCIPEVRNPSVKTGQDTGAETSERTVETDAGTPKPTAVAGNPPVEIEPVVRKSQPKATLSLDVLANGNAELRDLLDVIQEKNPTRVIDRGDVSAWLKLADNFAELAQKCDTSPVGLVMQAVLEAIGANSDREGFLAPNLARRILERWQKEAVAKGRTEEEEPSTRSTVSSDHAAVIANPAGKHRATKTAPVPASQHLQTLEGIGSAREIWNTAQGELKLQMTRATFDSWIRPARALGWENGHDDSMPTLVVGVHSPYAKEWVEARLDVMIQRTVTGIVGRAVGVRYVVPAGERA
jgi:predicted RNA-binding Zn-ribbon protein involved in translation (DUF1610 family)